MTDLVDVAIDADRRVVHDADRGVYVVLEGDVAYTYVDGSATADLSDGVDSAGDR